METIETIRQIIIEDFLLFARKYCVALANGKHKEANKLHKNIHSLYKKAKEMSLSHLFSDFLGDMDECVRYWSATFCLVTKPTKAEKVLVELTKSKTIIGVSAMTTLDMWRKGMLDLL